MTFADLLDDSVEEFSQNKTSSEPTSIESTLKPGITSDEVNKLATDLQNFADNVDKAAAWYDRIFSGGAPSPEELQKFYAMTHEDRLAMSPDQLKRFMNIAGSEQSRLKQVSDLGRATNKAKALGEQRLFSRHRWLGPLILGGGAGMAINSMLNPSSNNYMGAQ